jgi:hypothetical protein
MRGTIMPDVYVEIGTAKGVPQAYRDAAQAAMTAAITAAVKKTGSGLTLVKSSSGKGIQVNVQVTKLVQDGNDVTCVLIGELFELPSKERFNPGGSLRGEGKVPGKIDAVAGDSVGAAVADLMGRISAGIAGSQAGPASTSTAKSKAPLIFIAPFDVAYTKDPNAAPLALAAKTTTAITNMMDRKIKANTTRFTQDATKFQVGSGMPAYVIGITVEAVVFNAGAKEMVATTKGYIAEHPGGNIKVTNIPGQAKQLQMTKPPSDADKVQLLVDAGEQGTETAIKWILQTHP